MHVARPRTGHRWALRVGIQERRRTQAFIHARAPAHRDQHHRRDIDQQRPERAVRQRVPAAHAEQVLRLQPADPERALHQPGRRHPAGLGQRRQQQRVYPGAEAEQHADFDAAAAGTAPVQPADQPRGELRDCSEGHQAVGGQGTVVAAAAVIAVGHQRQQQDGGTANPQHARSDIRRLLMIATAAQQDRHHQIVADHGRQRDGGHDDHAGRSREAADIGDQRQELAAFGQRQGQHHAVVGDTSTGAEQGHAGGGDRNHHRRDDHQVGPEHPARAADITHIATLDHRHMELARQADDGQETQQRLGNEPDRWQAGEQRMRRLDHRIGAVVEPQVGEQAQRDHRDQLDHRFQRDRQHHAVVVLGGIHLAGTEQRGEQRHQQRHVQRGIREEASRADVAGQHLQAHRDGFVLQGQVRHDADQRDHRHQCGQAARAAEPRGDEIGDGDHVLAACDQRQALDDPPAEHPQQQGPQVDRQVADAIAHRRADRTVERPRRAVHRQRQAVDHRAQPRSIRVHRATVTPPRHAEQQRGIGH